jgi:hypothetical protein
MRFLAWIGGIVVAIAAIYGVTCYFGDRHFHDGSPTLGQYSNTSNRDNVPSDWHRVR